jgi:DnaJ-class molecular chaperone
MIDKRYNITKKQLIELEDGERFCHKCDGKGRIPRDKKKGRHFTVQLQCDECLGDGKIDWIEEATGKKQKGVGHGAYTT